MASRPILVSLAAVALAMTVLAAARAQSARPAPTDKPETATIDELVGKVDPATDDWIAEARSGKAAKRLARLAELLVQGASPAELLVPDARATPLRPKAPTRTSAAGDLTVLRFAGGGEGAATIPAAAALEQLVAPFDGASERRFVFKIVGAEAPDGERFTTRVRYEAAGRRRGGVIQQTAYWRVGWSGEGGAARIASIRLENLEEISRPSFMFTDSTSAVLPSGGGVFENLNFGGEYWHGRIDAVGEPNLMGHQGIAVGDFDGDGLEDLYVAMGTGLPNLLLVQQDDGTVRDVADDAGVAWLDDTKGVLFADTDNDGDQDLLTAIGPTIVLAKNDGKGKFDRFVGMRAPTPAAFYSLSAADYDLDGDLDIYGARYVKQAYGISVPLPFHDADNGPTNHLMRNDGDDRFTDVTVASGLGVHNSRFSLIGSWNDFDGDGDPDLYVANDFGRNNLYRNDDGAFVDVAAEAGAEDQAAGMGVSWSDYDLDGDFDLYVTNMFSAAGSRVAYQPRFKRGADEEVRRQVQRHSVGNSLLANQGDGTFRDVSDAAGVRMGRWGWGARFVDLNNDGYDDLVVPNGFLTGALEDDL